MYDVKFLILVRTGFIGYKLEGYLSDKYTPPNNGKIISTALLVLYNSINNFFRSVFTPDRFNPRHTISAFNRRGNRPRSNKGGKIAAQRECPRTKPITILAKQMNNNKKSKQNSCIYGVKQFRIYFLFYI